MTGFLEDRSRASSDSDFALAQMIRDALASLQSEVTSINDEYGLLRPDTPEMRRYVMTLDRLRSHAEKRGESGQLTLCDVGGYFGIIAAAASAFGYAATVVDTYGPLLTDPHHRDLRAWWEHRGISVHDVDLQAADLELPFASGSFDVVTLLAVIEHFPHTPRIVLEEIRRILRPNGLLVVDTPNAGALGTRIGFLLHGEGLWDPVDRLYFSDIPFPGHSRCYSRKELVSVIKWAGFQPEEVTTFDLKMHETGSFRRRMLYGGLYRLVLARLGDVRGYLWVSARPIPDDRDDAVASAKVCT